MNFFKLYIGDYQRDTAHLSLAEHGAYILMLQHYYATGKPLPSGTVLHRMLRAQDKTEKAAIDAIAAQFWTLTEDGLVNERAKLEVHKAAAQAENNARIAHEREEKRKQEATRREHEESTIRATNDQPNHSHSHKNTKPTSKPSRAEALMAVLSPLVEGLDLDAWKQFVDYRSGIGKALKAPSAKASQARLVRLGAGGNPQLAIVEQSIAQGWTGLFALKTGDTHAAHQRIDNSAVARVERATAHLYASGTKRAHDGGPLAPDDADLRPPLDVGVRRDG